MKKGSLFQLSQPIEPDLARLEPAVWVRRLMIVESLEAAGRIIRDIRFRRGMNVIRTAERSPDESSPVGHSVGKTLLLRLLRYCLGESSFSTDAVRVAITNSLRDAYVLAEVCLGGEWWAVARPIGMAHSISASRAARTENADDLRRSGAEPVKFGDYLDAIQSLSSPWFLPMKLPSAGHPPRWVDLLAWLARDQDCRMKHALEWRDPESNSGTAQLAREDASLLIRMVTGLFHEDERKLREHHGHLLAEQAELKRQVQSLTNRLEASEADLREELGIPESDHHGSLFAPDALRAAEEKAASLQRLLAGFRAESTLPDLEARAREATVEVRVAEELIARLQAELTACQGELKQLEEADTQAFYASFAQQERWCHLFQTREEAVTKGCPGQAAASPGARDPLQQQRIEETKDRLDQLRVRLRRLEDELARDRVESRKAEARLRSERDQHDTRIAEVREQIGRYAAMIERAARLGELANELARLRSRLEGKAKTIAKSSETQGAARERLARSLSALSGLFDTTLKRLLSPEAGGKIEIDATSVRACPNSNVAASGAALGTWATVVGFDLACLIASVCGLGNHPRLLLHDSPREADIEELMYYQLFNLVVELESAFGKKEPSFQYIVTTTTAPPRAIAGPPYVREVLGARSDDDLLLKTKLLM